MTRARGGRLLATPLAISLSIGLLACGAAPRGARLEGGSASGGVLLPDVRIARDRPAVVLVAREGDPSAAVAVAVTTSGLSVAADDEPATAAALAGVVEARLAARGIAATVTTSWDGYRASALAADADGARAASEALRAALGAPIRDADLAGATKKLAALGARPLADPSLARWARCVGSPYTLASRAGRAEDVTIAKLEAWRAAAHAAGRVAFAVAGPPEHGEAVAADVARGDAWRTSPPRAAAAEGDGVDAYDAPADAPLAPPLVHVTLDVGSSSAAVATAEALGDPRGPLATRLGGLDLPFRLREVTGAAHARGGCVGVVLEAAQGAQPERGAPELAARVAEAVALVQLEARACIASEPGPIDGRTLARRAGDAREAAERAAWWMLADSALASTPTPRGSVVLAVPARRAGAPSEGRKEALAAALQRAVAGWQRPIVEARTRVERGQGEAWVLVASPCGTDVEGDADAGLSALFAFAAAEMARSRSETRVEPWIVADGIGLVAHGPALEGETPASHARRLADTVARSFAADPIAPSAVTRARADLSRRDARDGEPALGALASALSPGHPSWIVPLGAEEAAQRVSDATVAVRAQALRSGPLRIAVLANVDAAQGDAAARAVDRWIDRRGEARACRPPPSAAPPRPGTYAVETRPGASPEALLAFPLPPGDEVARSAASTVASALDGGGGLLERALGGGAALARSSSARVLGWPRAPALVLRVTSAQASLDAAVMQVRALVDRIRRGGLPPADLDRATSGIARASTTRLLDPRARLVATWRGEPVTATRAASAEDTRAFAAKYLSEDTMIVVAARPARSAKASP